MSTTGFPARLPSVTACGGGLGLAMDEIGHVCAFANLRMCEEAFCYWVMASCCVLAAGWAAGGDHFRFEYAGALPRCPIYGTLFEAPCV